MRDSIITHSVSISENCTHTVTCIGIQNVNIMPSQNIACMPFPKGLLKSCLLLMAIIFQTTPSHRTERDCYAHCKALLFNCCHSSAIIQNKASRAFADTADSSFQNSTASSFGWHCSKMVNSILLQFQIVENRVKQSN